MRLYIEGDWITLFTTPRPTQSLSAINSLLSNYNTKIVISHY
nr:MAG TPA: hypothetical protein [Caudoviricetes sp.]